MAEGTRKPGIFIPLVGGGGLTVVAIVWWVFRSQMDPVCDKVQEMEPRLYAVERQQEVLAAKVITRLDAIDAQLQDIRRTK